MKPSNLPEIGQGITWTGAVGSFVGAIKSIDLLTVVGALVAVGGFLMNWHYSRQRNERERREDARKEEVHRLEMQKRELELKKQQGECHE
ncbi:holin [Neisseria bacilliformis]|uniref:holin n=2 Tax=Neisseria bacilliformis TaxID=267212 RepID=UPI0028E4141C|nr:holin [Neisseria bacilliformis]